MATKAQNYRRGNNGAAGRTFKAAGKIGGDGGVTTPLGSQQAPREPRSTAHMAETGQSATTRTPASRKHAYK